MRFKDREKQKLYRTKKKAAKTNNTPAYKYENNL